MRVIPLLPVPNQSLSIIMDTVRYDIMVRDVNSAMGITVSRDGIKICDNVRAVPDMPLFPYDYQQALAGGNFMFVTDDGQYPHWSTFGDTTAFVYASTAELEALS